MHHCRCSWLVECLHTHAYIYANITIITFWNNDRLFLYSPLSFSTPSLENLMVLLIETDDVNTRQSQAEAPI